MKYPIVVGTVMGALLLFALGGAAATVVQMADNGKEICVKVGEIIELALKEQAGTGYVWEFQDLDERHFKVLHTASKSLAEANRVGGPLLRTWQIQVLAPGDAGLSLDYLRPWEGRAKAVKHFALKVHITKD